MRKPPSKPANIAEIAAAAGVSKMTVSRALNDLPSVAEKTKLKIQAIAREMKYAPNLLVRGITRGQTRTIGCIISPAGEYPSFIIKGVHDELALHDYAMILSCDPDPTLKPSSADQNALIQRLIERRVDGIILQLNDNSAPSGFITEIYDRGTPLVLISQPLADKQLPLVESANFDGGRQAGVVAWEMGHRNLGFVGGPPQLAHCKERFKGFLSPFQESGEWFHFHEVAFVDWGFPVEIGLDLLTRQPRPTVIFCVADFVAPGIYEAAARLGLRIPQDVSVIGFGNFGMGSVMSPPLTSVEQFPQKIGRMAARTLLEILRFPNSETAKSPQVHRIGAEFILKKSLGPPPAA